MKMNTFVKFVLFCTLIRYSEVRSCKLAPREVESLHVQVFFALEDGRFDATRHLIDTVCDNYKRFGDKMTVEFIEFTYLEITDEGYPTYPYHWNDEIAEMCGQMLAQNPLDYICCKSTREECLTQLHISLDDFDNCVHQDSYDNKPGQRLRDNNQKMMDAGVGEGTLPALRFNDQKYHKCTDNAAYDDFIKTCCKLYKPDCAPKPTC